MSKKDEYLGYARQCQQLAEESQSLSDKRNWRKIAESWLKQAAEPDDSHPPRSENTDRHHNR
jgi:hypothetical protein